MRTADRQLVWGWAVDTAEERRGRCRRSFVTDKQGDGGCVNEESVKLRKVGHGVLKAYLVLTDVSPCSLSGLDPPSPHRVVSSHLVPSVDCDVHSQDALLFFPRICCDLSASPHLDHVFSPSSATGTFGSALHAHAFDLYHPFGRVLPSAWCLQGNRAAYLSCLWAWRCAPTWLRCRYALRVSLGVPPYLGHVSGGG